MNDDGNPGFSRLFKLRELNGIVRVDVPNFFAQPPDVAKASAFRKRGGRSDVAVVLIR